MPFGDAARPWHDMYALFGTASATLVGLLFVAVSVGSAYFTPDRHPALRVFLSPSVVHFSSVLATCLIAMTPGRSWWIVGMLTAVVGALGVGYCGLVWRSMVRNGMTANIDLEDRIYYAALPAAGHGVIIAAGIAFLCRNEIGCGVLAFAMALLLAVCVRNAWDITVWTVIKRPR